MHPIFKLLTLRNTYEVTARGFTGRQGKNPYNWKGEGVRHPGFKYYPRQGDGTGEEAVPYEPTKLFRVQRIKPMKGLPYWEKKILGDLKLDQKTSDVVVVKNIPEINSRLWRIKHVVKIAPITFPNGMPKDVNGTYLKENGELVVMKKIYCDEERAAACEKFEKDPKKLNGDVMRRELRKRWLVG